MRSLYKSFLCTFVFWGCILSLYAQDSEIQHICGSDTIKMSLDNYQYGKIDWQESVDGVHWLDIKDQHDTALIYFTTEEKYIRGCITTSECEQVFSNTAFIVQKPIAYAGIDRDVMGTHVTLFGSKSDGAEGLWEILKGKNGTLAYPDSAVTGFTAQGDTLYELTWTLENQCGSTTDTLLINIIENTYNKKHLAVDPTSDSLLIAESDTAAGIYCIKFYDLEGVIPDPDILIGMDGDGYLRKIDSIHASVNGNDSTYKYFTSQGSMEDLILDGVFSDYDITQVADDPTKSAKPEFILNRPPTRKELMNDPKYRDGVYVYYYPDEYITSSVVKSVNSSSKGLDIDLHKSLKMEKEGVGDLTVGMGGYIHFDPNFVFNYKRKRTKVKSLTAGLDNAVLENGIILDLKGKLEPESVSMKMKMDKQLFQKKSRKLIIAGGIPITITNVLACNFIVEPEFKATLDAYYKWSRSTSFSAYLKYTRGSGVKASFEKGQTTRSSDYAVVFEGDAGVDLTLATRVSMRIYGIIGPYLEVPISLKPSLCASARLIPIDDEPVTQIAYGFDVPLSIDANIGVEVKLFKKVLFDRAVDINIFNTAFTYPYSLGVISGNHQAGIPSESLKYPFKVQMKNNWGGGAPLIPMYWTVVEGDGILDQSTVFSASGGYAENTFVLGTSTYNKIRVEAFDCDFEPLVGAEELYFEVNTGCENSSLQLSFETLPGGIIETVGIMGAEPYQYSLDNENYTSDPIQMDFVAAAEQGAFYVMDDDGCLAVNNFEIIDSCEFSDLSVSVSVEAKDVRADGLGGVPPYLYALDSEEYYTSVNEFSSVSSGDHKVFVIDQWGCTASQPFNIKLDATDSLVAYYPFNGNARDMSGNYHDGIASGAALVPDRFGNANSAFLFHDTSMIKVPAHDDFIMEGDFTITFWSYTDLEGQYPKEGHFAISIGEFDYNPGELHIAYYDTSSIMGRRLILGNTSQMVRDFDENMEGQWCLYTIVRYGPVLIFARNTENLWATAYTEEMFRDCDIYFGNTADSLHPLNGILDDVRFYDRALSPDELHDLYAENGWIDGPFKEPFTDPRDGNDYKQVKIGEQVWMGENLKWLPAINWAGDTSSVNPQYVVYAYYGTDVLEAAQTENYAQYGVLYNTVAAATACPAGWRLPTLDDWEELRTYAELTYPDEDPGLTLKSESGWLDINGSDTFHFSGKPGGYVVENTESGGHGTRKGERGLWHISGMPDWMSMLEGSTFEIGPNFGGEENWMAISIRCIKE